MSKAKLHFKPVIDSEEYEKCGYHSHIACGLWDRYPNIGKIKQVTCMRCLWVLFLKSWSCKEANERMFSLRISTLLKGKDYE